MGDNINARIQAVMDHGQFILGPEVRELEETLAAYVGVKHCVGVSSGTDSLLIALMALAVGPGDEVITTPHTFGATAEAIGHLGARIVFADVEEDYLTLDSARVQEKVTDRTRVIMPVHIYGHPADMDGIMNVAEEYDLTIIEDAAQAFGSYFKNKPLGSYGDFSCFSFHET